MNSTELYLSIMVMNLQHSGVFDFALSCWILLTFGPQVCRAYGPFTFFLIYVLGGFSGNMISFVHTLEPTVGGTVSRGRFFFSLSSSFYLPLL